MKVLLIEDDEVTAQAIKLMLHMEDIHVTHVDTGEDALFWLSDYPFDIATLRLDLPDMTGQHLLHVMRERNIDVPVIFLTGHTAIETRVACLNAGADDFIVKPFHKDELIARIRAVLRRRHGVVEECLKVGNLKFNTNNSRISIDDEMLYLTGQERRMLECLLRNNGNTCSKTHILNYLYNGMDEPELKIIDVFICKLRTKLRKAGFDGHIETVWGVGYKIAEGAEKGDAPATPRPPKLTRKVRLLKALDELGGEASARQIALHADVQPVQISGALHGADDEGLLRFVGINKRYKMYVILDKGRQFYKEQIALFNAESETLCNSQN